MVVSIVYSGYSSVEKESIKSIIRICRQYHVFFLACANGARDSDRPSDDLSVIFSEQTKLCILEF